MSNYDHKKLAEVIARLNEVPDELDAFSDWIRAEALLGFLRDNARSNEVVVCALGKSTYIHSLVVENSKLSPIDKDNLLHWSLNPYHSIASYISGGGNIWIERGLTGTDTKALEGAIQLIFGRSFEGWNGPGRNYNELNQEYAHLNQIHWRPELHAYCSFTELGDLEPIVTSTSREENGTSIDLVSFKWQPLEEYLATSHASLVRLFDFTLFRPLNFNGWPHQPPQNYFEKDDFFYHQNLVPAHASYTRGVQIIGPRHPEKKVLRDLENRWSGKKRRQYVEFIALDWRNRRVTKISTNPRATANYFNAEGNSLPFELSPAFFRPEVLLKYKADRDKYMVTDRSVSCRAAWSLESIDVNEAGQIHAYICDLRNLPYEEQLYWCSYNEKPKETISKRALINDFEGEWTTFSDPLQEVISLLRRWHDDKVSWWILRGGTLLDRVNIPLTNSRDEWAEAFMDLAKLVIEGFETKQIRAKLGSIKISFEKDDKTIALLEKLINKDNPSDEFQKLVGLRTVQLLRSKAKGHAAGEDADRLAQDALLKYETFGNHFKYICAQVFKELELIEQTIP